MTTITHNLILRSDTITMKSISYTTLATALEAWDMVSQHQNAENEFGTLVLNKFFELQPKAKIIFGCTHAEEKVSELRIAAHALAFWHLFESVFLLLGPDLEFIEDILKSVGLRHKAMGVKPSYFPYMFEALVDTMEHISRKPLTADQRNAWEDLFEAVSDEIVKSMLL